MPRTFTTQQIQDVDIDQITITRTKDLQGNQVIRVRSNVTVKLVDTVDPLRSTVMNLNVNNTVQELNVGAQVIAIRSAILTALRNQIT